MEAADTTSSVAVEALDKWKLVQMEMPGLETEQMEHYEEAARAAFIQQSKNVLVLASMLCEDIRKLQKIQHPPGPAKMHLDVAGYLTDHVELDAMRLKQVLERMLGAA